MSVVSAWASPLRMGSRQSEYLSSVITLLVNSLMFFSDVDPVTVQIVLSPIVSVLVMPFGLPFGTRNDCPAM